jgi:hypothetical protein
MKNKLSHSIKILTFLIAAGACTDLEMASDGRDSLGSIFANYSKARSYYQSIIKAVPEAGNPAHYGTLLSSFSDEAQDVGDVSNSKVALWYAGGVTALRNPLTEGLFEPWSHYFTTIRRCNTFLQAMDDPQMLAFEIGETEKSGWMAQVRVMRAFAYLQLMKRYGAVPIMDTPSEVDHDYSTTVRNTVEEVTDFILADCDSALASPDEKSLTAFRWNLTEGDRGVISRAFAWAVKSEAALCAASPLFFESGSKYTWDKAAQVTRAALDACIDHGFSLYSTPVLPATAQNPYAYYFIQQSDPSRQRDKETIFESSQQLTIWANHGTAGAWRGVTSAGSCPSQELVDAYETTNGQPVLDLNQPYSDASHLEPNYNAANTLYKPDDPYANRDPRFYASIYYNGAPRTLVGNAPVSLTFGRSGTPSTLQVTEGADGEVTISVKGTLSSASYVRTQDFPIPTDDSTIIFSFEYQSDRDATGVKLYAAKELPAFDLPKTGSGEWKEYKVNIIEFRNIGGGMTNLVLYPKGTSGYTITMRNIRVGPEVFVEPQMVETFAGGNSERRSDGLTNTRTGYYLRKYNNHRSDVNVASDGYMKIYRLGELYLNFAEAAYNAAGPDADVDGMTALQAVNAVRTRAGMPALPAGMSTADFEKRYRNERRVELAFEEKRFFDVRRWKVLGETDRVVTGMNITKKTDGTFAYERVTLKPRSCSDDKFLLFPINQAEVSKMNALTGKAWQNPGW